MIPSFIRMLIFLLAQQTNSLSILNLVFPNLFLMVLCVFLCPLKCVAFTTLRVFYRKLST